MVAILLDAQARAPLYSPPQLVYLADVESDFARAGLARLEAV